MSIETQATVMSDFTNVSDFADDLTRDITLCLTIGRRPAELHQTLTSLFSYLSFAHVIAINDFGDEATNSVFTELCPQGELISLGVNLGHHKAIDLMYAKVRTPFVFHCEDDWLFDSAPNITAIQRLLTDEPSLTSVCLRKISDMPFDEAAQQQLVHHRMGGIDVIEVTALHDQWYGYSFNPHIAPLATWQSLAPFAHYKKERHISRVFRAKNRRLVYLTQGNCQHIGFESIANPPPDTWLKKVKAKLFG